MAKQFVDAGVSTMKVNMAKQDGTALTLTNSVRILYEDTLSKQDLYVLINRIRDRILETELQ